MKKFFFPMMMALAAMLMISLFSCQKEDNIRPIEMDTVPDITPTLELNGTSWQGDKATVYMDYGIELVWTFDFTSETDVDVQVDIELAGQTATRSTTGTYTLDGTTGTLKFWNKTFDMTYHASRHTIVVQDLTMSLSNGTEITEVGGETVLHQI